ncbi:similar to VZV orf2, EHV-4 gene 3 [Meleagrid alphaherpesvirus 1]|uniref:LORF4 n=1 Tax=Meleagrid herpesvirus 1 TaxID=37108 RepID=Q9DGT5_MEHV1|nr:myristylated tegument protein CIRC [Meleagrid alphaherpesvirus 1]AKQ48640.1 myristylated tegument protein CIRC [iBAC vector pMeHV1-C7]AKQ48712.1 myristylated tegument protein CIRC [iBAC vector pMeHV1-C9]AKQ48784.1 myristylated tegument protein CIRC [iBAC vector pMeHV1-C10]AKQ48856.1 myristylated tegument protein CIRC [iBAC vector pMeHV1-C17]AKQ48929.1 myristylated tegument protein CIRC [iBAC vector pMeHV1-C18]
MGSRCSKKSACVDKTLVQSLRGRNLDLPHGGYLGIFANAGATTVRFVPSGSSRPMMLTHIGHACTDGLLREFVIFEGQDGSVYGTDNNVSLHFLGRNLHDILSKRGMSQRDVMVIKGKFFRSEITQLPKQRSRLKEKSDGSIRTCMDSVRINHNRSTVGHFGNSNAKRCTSAITTPTMHIVTPAS